MVLQASEIILEVYKQDFTVDYKAGDEPVTIADKKCDDFIVKTLKAKFPKDEILTEENGLHSPANHSGRLWIIDPIDGTREFINKTGEFSIQVGLAHKGELSLGVIYQPTAKALYIAAVGQGCWRHTNKGWEKLQVETGPSENLTIAVSRSFPCPTGQFVHKSVSGKAQIHRGGVGLKLMAIANKEAHYYINNSNKTKSWDSAAPEILFKEAGGTITDLKGRAFVYNSHDFKHKNGLLATYSADLHKEVLKFAKKA